MFMGGFPRGNPFNQDDDMNGSHTIFSDGGMRSSMPGMGGRSKPQRKSGFPSSSTNEKPSEITRPLKVSLEDLYSGALKHLKVTRRLLDGTTEDKVIEIQIHPGWKSGTKIRFPQAGHEQPGGKAQDMVFVIEEKPHETLRRDGNNLVCNIELSLVESLTGPPPGVTKFTKTVDMLDGRKLQVPVPLGIVKPGQETLISGEGMPIRKEGTVKNKGDLIVRWEVGFPDRLTPAQKQGIRKVLA